VIRLTRLSQPEPDLVINAELIETVEAKPDTVVTLTTGHKVIVQESVDQVIQLVIQYKRAIHQP
jgi:flagellar protein FlbD